MNNLCNCWEVSQTAWKSSQLFVTRFKKPSTSRMVLLKNRTTKFKKWKNNSSSLHNHRWISTNSINNSKYRRSTNHYAVTLYWEPSVNFNTHFNIRIINVSQWLQQRWQLAFNTMKPIAEWQQEDLDDIGDHYYRECLEKISDTETGMLEPEDLQSKLVIRSRTFIVNKTYGCGWGEINRKNLQYWFNTLVEQNWTNAILTYAGLSYRLLYDTANQSLSSLIRMAEMKKQKKSIQCLKTTAK